MSAQPTEPTITIKKYSNRRLYDMTQKRYITLEELRDLIQGGAAVQVLDSKTSEDLTQPVLIQLILETEKAPFQGLLTTELLHTMIRYQDKSLSDFYQRYLPNIMQSYVHWQQEAQDHFMHWAKLGWQANQMSQDMFMPGLNWWGGAPSVSSPSPSPSFKRPPVQESHQDNQTELEALKAKLAKMEAELSQALQSETLPAGKKPASRKPSSKSKH
jgi:polyhydroxyalkanoate synthesis repressor PhaR